MKLSKLFRVKESRKYPIKRDIEGLSLRARCFELFEQGKRPVVVVEELKINETTVFRYFRDWKRLGPSFEPRYAYVKSLFKKTASDRDSNIELFSGVWGIEKEQLEAILSQPHGLRRLMTGKLFMPAHGEIDHKRHVSLQLALLISDHVTKHGGKIGDVFSAIKRYIRENMKYREKEDTQINEENKWMKFVHSILATDMENERRGRVKLDTLSVEERNALTRYGEESQIKRTEVWYWFVIGILKASGFTPEQAHETIYKTLLDKGDLEGVKIIQEFQKKVYPLEKNVQVPPPSPGQQPSSTT